MRLYIILAIIFILMTLACAPCADDDDGGNDDDDGGDDDDSASSDTWTDPSTGLMWQKESATWYTWDEAKSYCQNLNWGGYDDWRLPSFSELRSLIRGCDNTETGGSCGVTDSCLDSSCLDYFCEGCPIGSGPDDGCFWPSQLNGDCDWFWSSSALTDSDDAAWGIDFNGGNPDNSNVNHGTRDVRCVR